MSNKQLRALLAEAGWRPETLARRIGVHARAHGVRVSVHEKTPYSWIRDGRCPHDPVPLLVSEVLAAQLGRPVEPADLGWRTTPTGLLRADDGLPNLWFAGGAFLGLKEVSSGVHRRNLLALTGSALTAVALQAIVAEPARIAAVAAGGRSLDEQVVADLEQLVELRRRMEDQLGGGALHEALTSDLRLVTRLLSDTSYPQALGCRLYAVAAELARLAGWCSHDAGHEGAAQRYWLVALRAAHEARDAALSAHVLMMMAVQSKSVGDPRESITLFNSARHVATGSTQRAVIAAAAAGAHARIGDAGSTVAQVEQTFAQLELSTVDDDPVWLAPWAERGQLAGDAGSAFLHLGEPARAIPRLREAIDSLPEFCVRDHAHRRVRLATAQLRIGEAEQALATAHDAVDLSARLDSGKVRTILAEFCAEATGTVGGSAAADLTEHARTALRTV